MTDTALMDFGKYQLIQSVDLDKGRRVAIFATYPDEANIYPELFGRNAYIFNKSAPAIQIIKDGTESTEEQIDFTYFFERNGEYFIQDNQGFVYSLDLLTGVATKKGWTRL